MGETVRVGYAGVGLMGHGAAKNILDAYSDAKRPLIPTQGGQ